MWAADVSDDCAVGMRCPILVGRDAELGALRAHVAAALDGRGGFAMVRGEAGLGKSRLCRELIDGVSGAGTVATVGRHALRRERGEAERLLALAQAAAPGDAEVDGVVWAGARAMTALLDDDRPAAFGLLAKGMAILPKHPSVAGTLPRNVAAAASGRGRPAGRGRAS